jgi:hypothetical protein
MGLVTTDPPAEVLVRGVLRHWQLWVVVAAGCACWLWRLVVAVTARSGFADTGDGDGVAR